MATVSIIFRKDKLNKNGQAPIHFRIIKDRKINYISSSILLFPSEWDEKNKKVKKSHSNSARFNSYLANKFTELQDQVFEHETFSKSTTTKQLKSKIFGKKPLLFFPFAESVFERYKRQGQVGTHDRCKAIINKLKKYVKEAPICFQEMTPEFMVEYEKHLRGKEHNNSTNTIHTNFKFIRQLFNEAINSDVLDAQFYPFKKFKVKTEKTQRQYLTEDELTEIENVDCSSGVKLDLHRDMFVFAAYTGGLRVSDVLKLKWKYIDKTHINLTIKKTGSQLSIKIPDKAFKIIEKYKPKKVEKDNYIFPMLPNGLKEDDLVLLDTEISGATAYINKNLKTIAEKAKIGKPLSFHISRHTWATRALRKGISIDKVSKLMGHAQIKETQIYAKIVNEELDKAMDVFNEPAH
jgi:integrase/recombinase XerD